ncbi:L,D-transpeptidase [Gordonia hydrophobica]|uniref:L,D-transpeptidase n=1 Tax=Gordonia hydrophobica TaxID=40516 RepID=A0ABZ2U5I4_9ACTN|nr:L,D-transpeptidase [Gordonia hydrophobica]MBM7365729.1 lipoprotein-anchoring transpeptidase ErfK/SrfK [Gordonia hydrophobica]
MRGYAWTVALAAAVLVVTVALTARIITIDQPAMGSTQAAPRPSAPAAGDAPSPCPVDEARKRVLVSVSRQHLWLCDDGRSVATSPVTTGRSATGHGTPLGSWRIVSHETARYLEGPGYRIHVHFWLPFFGDIGFHDSPWQRFPYGDLQQYKTEGSQGCIHVPGPMMAELYRWTRVGTAVTIAA